MFQRVKNSYKDIAVCRNGKKEGRYSFIENYDGDWVKIAESKFREEFGVNPTEISLESREKI